MSLGLNLGLGTGNGGSVTGAAWFVTLPLVGSPQSTHQDSTAPLVCGSFAWKTSRYLPNGLASPSVKLRVLAGTTNVANAAKIDLYDVTGAAVVADSLLTSTDDSTEQTADLSSFFAGLSDATTRAFRARLYMSPSVSTELVTLYHAHLEISGS